MQTHRLVAEVFHTNAFLCVKYALHFMRFGSRCPLVAQTQLEDVADSLRWRTGWHTNRARGASNSELKEAGAGATHPGFRNRSSSCMSTSSHTAKEISEWKVNLEPATWFMTRISIL